ncbi:ferritin, lower subunit [Bombina bombina]|uniref:ferritin, lower subunit n=1 Tax=Bombina bombina TaxID=8345 RepID=UPI00235AA88F|nr:ferritin, lower subunit [Bombina bombina]
MESQVRHNFHQDCEAGLNRMVNLKYRSSYVYLSLCSYFNREDVALANFSKFFRKCYEEEQEHAEKLIKYQNERGGRVYLHSIEKPERDDWTGGLEALQTALKLEKTVNQALLDLHSVAGDKNDPHMCDFLESPFLSNSTEMIKKLADHITNLKNMSKSHPGMAEYLFDKHTLG